MIVVLVLAILEAVRVVVIAEFELAELEVVPAISTGFADLLIPKVLGRLDVLLEVLTGLGIPETVL